MAAHTESYKDCEIIIKNESDLTINGKQIDYEHTPGIDKWNSRLLPYSEYQSLLDLARAIIRDTVEFTHANP